MSQSFELVTEPKPKKRHINDSFIDKYKDIVVEKLNEWPVDNVLNWSVIARHCNLPGTNAGQKVKELATECGIGLVAIQANENRLLSAAQNVNCLAMKYLFPSMPTENITKKRTYKI